MDKPSGKDRALIMAVRHEVNRNELFDLKYPLQEDRRKHDGTQT
ncbi:hypothetical protein EKH55_0350 [Sinorhizobium alkalisoli]|nr:hypothetical protein EKH55_0350 [Sinorhizobium alkalisoli]